MSDQIEQALSALLKQVTALTEKVEAQDKKFENTFKMNERLLRDKKGPKPDDKPDVSDIAASMQALADKMAKPALDATPHRKDGDPVAITRTDALDARKYDAAKAQATELGVPLEMIDDRPSARVERPATYQSRETDTSMIDTVDDTAQKVRWVRHDVATGGAGLIQNSLAAERDGYRLATFKSDDDLPDAMKTKIGLMASAAGGGDAD
ncbi:hypothetical protein [Ruegeria sp.]|uniref:hypothetical protein n=1 Tax=Ruegeria sp. TaxID=1879320 RepID=UPI003C7AD947